MLNFMLQSMTVMQQQQAAGQRIGTNANCPAVQCMLIA
jgi:hypothetical protein